MTRDFLNGLKPFYQLDIDISQALNPELDLIGLKKEANDAVHIWRIPHEKLPDVFDQDWLEYMRGMGLDVGSCLIFYRDAYYLHPSVHIDIHKPTGTPSHYAINWVLDPHDDSDMIWYTWPTEDSGTFDNTPADTPYLGWDIDKFTGQEIYRHTIGNQVTLVNTSMPHNVETKTKSRWAFSVRFKREDNNGAGHSWEKGVDFFQKYMK